MKRPNHAKPEHATAEVERAASLPRKPCDGAGALAAPAAAAERR
jgi:hypothetical protein